MYVEKKEWNINIAAMPQHYTARRVPQVGLVDDQAPEMKRDYRE